VSRIAFAPVDLEMKCQQFVLGHVEVSLKWGFEPRVTIGGILSEQNLELLMGQFYTSTTLMYSRGNFKPV